MSSKHLKLTNCALVLLILFAATYCFAFELKNFSVRRLNDNCVYAATVKINAFKPPVKLNIDWGDGSESTSTYDPRFGEMSVSHKYNISQQTTVSVSFVATDKGGRSVRGSKSVIITP